MWCGVLGMWWTVFQEIHNEPEHRKISLSTVSLLPWEGNPSCRSGCVCVCHSEIHRGLESLTLSLTLAHTHTNTHSAQSLLFVCFGCNTETMVPGHTSLQFQMAGRHTNPKRLSYNISHLFFSFLLSLSVFYSRSHPPHPSHPHIQTYTTHTDRWELASLELAKHRRR